MLNIYRNHKVYYGGEELGEGGMGVVGWLKCCFTSTETVGSLGTGAQDVHLDFHTAPELSMEVAAAAVVLLNVLGCRLA